MKDKRIAIIVAMPEEARPLVRKFGRCRKELVGQFPACLFSVAGRTICLIISGMGVKKARLATKAAIAAFKPQVIVSAGFGGGVRRGLAVGDVVVAENVLSLAENLLTETATMKNGLPLRGLDAALPDRPFRIENGCIVTTCSIARKETVSGLLPAEAVNPVLDMETSAVAAEACSAEIPLIALRAISDAADEEMLFSLDEITDQDLNIRMGKILCTLLKKPAILPQMIRLAGNAKLAGRNLATVLDQVIRLM